MYLSLLQIKNFRCFDGNEHSITFKKGLNVLVGENDSGKSAIMDAIKLVLGTTDFKYTFSKTSSTRFNQRRNDDNTARKNAFENG